MTSFQATVTWQAAHPLDQSDLDWLATLGGVATGLPGQHRATAIFTVAVADRFESTEPTVWETATTVAIGMVDERVPGRPVAVELVTVAEADRRLAEPAPAVLHDAALQMIRDLLPADTTLVADTLESIDPAVNGWALETPAQIAVIDAALALERQ